ncbi:MAG: hypothetical protein WDA37_07665 [Dysgonamonadaceae bacterium]
METKKIRLENIDKKVPFKVPENYFSQFNESLMANLPVKETPKVRKITIWEKSKPWVYMAAMFLGLFFTIQLLVKNSNTPQTASNTFQTEQNYWGDVKISEDDFFDYVETQFVDENYYDLVYNQVYLNSL